MNDASRFERGERYSVVRDITTYRGVDPVTGLDVLVYDFPGEPTAAAGSLTSEHILPILAASSSNGIGTVVSALPFGAQLVAPGEREIDDRFVLQAAGALRDAHELGLVHGDLSGSRLLYARPHVYLEGYGVPWAGDQAQTGERALHADLQSLVRALLQLAGDNLSTEVSAALKGAAAKGAYPPMNAPRLHAIIRRLAGGAVKVPAAGFSDLTLPTTASHAGPTVADANAPPGDRPKPPGVSGPEVATKSEAMPAAVPSRPKESAGSGSHGGTAAGSTERRPNGLREEAARREAAEFHDPEPITLNSDPGLVPPGQSPASEDLSKRPSPRDTSPGFVKALPPGAKYRHGNIDDGLRPAPIRFDQEEAAARRRSWRGPALFVLVLLVAALGATIALLRQQQDQGGATTSGPDYLVAVRVEPANLPPVSLIVDQSPPDSAYAPGTVLGSVPHRVPFDAVGTWVVHGEFQRRTTPPVTVQVPADVSVTLTFPPADAVQP